VYGQAWPELPHLGYRAFIGGPIATARGKKSVVKPLSMATSKASKEVSFEHDEEVQGVPATQPGGARDPASDEAWKGRRLIGPRLQCRFAVG
jgi:hypothetical protein